MPQDRKMREKQLRFRAWHRGTKEADIILGNFADRFLSDMDDAELEWFAELLKEKEQDVLDWIFGRNMPPAPFDTALMTRIKQLDYIPVKN